MVEQLDGVALDWRSLDLGSEGKNSLICFCRSFLEIFRKL